MTTPTQEIRIALDMILQNALSDGGFSRRRQGAFSVDATAWAVMALKAIGNHAAVAQSACRRLMAAQLPDGRIPMAPHLPEAYWPTPLAILAWGEDPKWRSARERASQFLLSVGGITFPYAGDPTQGSDSSLKGWAWVDGTYSWVIPTAFAMMALICSGYQDHPRIAEATKMLMNRQIPTGGWNCGATYALGTQLLPLPETTGHALSALTGAVATERVQYSVAYLQEALPGLTSPLSLAWAVLGLGAWSTNGIAAQEQIIGSLQLQGRYGTYDTDLLAQLMVAYFRSSGLTCEAMR